MKKLLAIAAALGALSPATPAFAGGAAVCIDLSDNRTNEQYDGEYFMRWGAQPSVDGDDAIKAARADHRKNYPDRTPYCRRNPTHLDTGTAYFVLIKTKRTKTRSGGHFNRWALGFGRNRAAALADAKSEMRQRDRLWTESGHGYTIDDEDNF
ncbi:hypothetical protein GCM10023115_01620 [Pontixanthobacter gangjinensis]|uniref:Uncharacterized protein n=1 Tax=Pontixanthobacter gangjinensis TaxID=1028742 RepID=A0A6I4SKU8_9SPHN|nr:hypothetical protein [Pontixanthobacter gangjinensis]MXO55417.1 hypothetical protein [Pontixanthobacter gangjinensis]